jgi:putative colanic acid biosynthesis glycosyltransferase WcaI
MTVFLVTQHYRPDETSTSVFLTAIAEEIARDNDVVVLSGSRGSASSGNPHVSELPNWSAPKGALVRRSLAMLWFCVAAFVLVSWRARRDTPVLVVTTPFLLPYFTILGARLRRAPTALIVYDIYPDVLIASGITKENSWLTRATRRVNQWLFSVADAIVIIGRDMEKHVTRYGAASEKVCYIPHWSTLPARESPIARGNAFGAGDADTFTVGLSGNLGFTHDPETVLRAAQHLSDDRSIHFLLSGWGVGWDRLVAAQRTAKLKNVTLIERVSEDHLDDLLAAADIWIIPYRRNMAGLSVPSRLYNILAIGRPVIALSESDAEHALMLSEYDAGWVVEPENPAALAATISAAAGNPQDVLTKRRNAMTILAGRFTRDASGAAYRSLVQRLRMAHVGNRDA